MKNILVTGANGLLGLNTIIELIAQGYCVKGYLRDSRKITHEIKGSLELVEGDIRDIQKLNSALRGCDCVIHTAAITDQNLLDYEHYYDVNVKGVMNITNAAIENKVKRIIYVGSANEFGYGNLDDLGDETREIKYPFNKSYYARSKKEAHDFILTKMKEIEVVVINPTFMIGAHDSKPSSGKLVLLGLRKRFVLCPPGGKNFICVKDVAKGIIKAINYGNNGEAYLLANENLTYHDFFKTLKKESDRNFIIIKVPNIMLQFAGLFGNMLRSIRVKTNFSSENMSAVCINSYYSNKKARTELGLEFSPITKGLKESVMWFRNKQII